MQQGLVQEQRLERKINQSFIQSLQMLQFTSVELYDYINDIVQENPLIDEVIYDFEQQPIKYKFSETFNFENMNTTEKNLTDHLFEQLLTMDVTEEQKKIIAYGIYSLNEAGYLEITLEDWAANCNVNLSTAEEALITLQKFEPAGIGARSLGECLYLQIRQMSGYKNYMEAILLNHLDWIADYNFQAIIDEFKISEKDITELNKMIQSCNPKPGQQFTEEVIEYIRPEANVIKDEAGWKIQLYNWSAPKLVFKEINYTYNDEETKKYLKTKMQQVEWLKRAVQYRTSTLEAVIHKVVEKQRNFFEEGLFSLEPLKLKDIALVTELHVSTISRAINNKYLQTPHGLFPLKFFFQNGYRYKKGEAATIVIKKFIHDLIANEDKLKPLSDEKIRKQLAAEHTVDVARRTVMKYRQQLNIPASWKRKETM